MALTRPTLLATSAFDATESHTLYFTVSSGSDQVVATRLVVRDNTSNAIVYDSGKVSNFNTQVTIPANTLTNGTYYNAVLYTYNVAGETSVPSISIQFWCYTKPTIRFTNMPTGNIIANSSFNFEFEYNQEQGELLNQYSLSLYSASHVLISTSGVLYAESSAVPYAGNYTFTGFENATTYYIKVDGVTVNGTEITTGLVQITVTYKRPDLFVLMELNNNCQDGYITIKSNFVYIEGKGNPDPPKYIDNKEVDLTAKDSTVDFTEGFVINGDISTGLWLRKPNEYSEVLRFSNAQGQTISIRFMKGYQNVNSANLQAYYECYVSAVNGVDYYIYSNYMDILNENDYYNVWFKRKGNLYSLTAQKV